MQIFKVIVMKKEAFAIATIVVFFIVGCNNKSSKENATSKISIDTSKAVADTTAIAEVTHTFNNVDPKLASSIKNVVDQYLQIKNGLVNNNGKDAAKVGKSMADELNKLDKSLLTAEQKKVYNGIEDDLKENAEHIGENADKIEHQREHFTRMSEDVYDLVKAFGTDHHLYQDYCPMANEKKGAIWLSETKEAGNPYFGGKMDECVKVEKVIK